MVPESVYAQIRDWPAHLEIVVEVVAGEDGKVPGEVLETAYRDSQNGVVALSLSNLSVSSVNKYLDRVVPDYPLDIPGVRYLETANSFLLRWVLCHARQAYGLTPTFHDTAVGAGFISSFRRYHGCCLVGFVRAGQANSKAGGDTPSAIRSRGSETYVRVPSNGA